MTFLEYYNSFVTTMILIAIGFILLYFRVPPKSTINRSKK